MEEKQDIEGQPYKVAAGQKFPVKLLWLPVLIVIVSYISFYPSFKCGFVNWDDNIMVTDNPLVLSDTLQLKSILTSPIAHLYHPLTTLSLALNYQAGKLDPSGYHSWNVYLHLFNTLFVFIFIYLLTGRRWMVAAIVSLLFGVHPMHVESVTWVAERKDVLFLFFFLPGLITYLYYRQTHKAFWYVLTLLLFLLSLLSKAHAVVFPLILLLLDYFLNEKRPIRLFAEKIPFFIIALAFGIFTYHIMQSGHGKMSPTPFLFPLYQIVCFTCYGLLMYLEKLVLPFNLATLYPYRILANNLLPPAVYLSPFILLGLTAVVYFLMRKNTVVVFGLLFFLVSIALVLQIIPNNRAIIADRYSYLSYIGLFFIPAWYINALWENGPVKFRYLKIPVTIVMAVFLAMCCFLTFQQCKVWHDSISLWNHAVKCNPKNPMPYNYRGDAYFHEEKIDSAFADFNMAINLNPQYAEAHASRGITYWALGKPELAIADCDTSISLNPYAVLPYYYLGIAYASQGKTEQAITDFNIVIYLKPGYALAYYSRGLAYKDEGKYDLAMAGFNKAISLDPGIGLAYYNRGILYATEGKNEQAISDFNTSIYLDAKYAPAYYSRGLAYWNEGKFDLSIANYTMAINLDPKSAPAYDNRGVAYLNQGKLKLAIADYDSAIALDPQFALAYLNRGDAYGNEGKPELEMADYDTAIRLNPRYPEAYLNRGAVYAGEGKPDLAIADFTAAIQLNPQYAQAYNNRGVLEKQKGDLARAEQDFQMAKKLQWGSVK